MGIGDTAVSLQFFSISSDPRLFQDLPGRKGLKFFPEVGKIVNAAPTLPYPLPQLPDLASNGACSS